MAVLTLPLVWEASRFYVCVTPEGLESRSAWRGTRFIAWDELYEVRYSSINSWFVFRGTSGEKIRVTGFVAGLPALLGFVEMRLPATVAQETRVPATRKPADPFPNSPRSRCWKHFRLGKASQSR